MTIQQDTNTVERALAGSKLQRLQQEMQVTPPSYGAPQRDAINSVVDGIVGDICSKINMLRKTLDTIEQQVLTSAAKSKHLLENHVSTCVKVNDEIRHMQEVIDELKGQTDDA